ncbi:hypothetical protein CJF30_00000008 [Rutstroemia sp. NJR-2017a BBW]|nr:hypothetical protein CJF30_00000008 [Rutstroemia sp. NJR-2017a BBW]
MSREYIEFQVQDNVTLRSWLYKPAGVFGRPEATIHNHVCWLGKPQRNEYRPHGIIPSIQVSNVQDAITYTQGHPNIDVTKVALWGSSYSGGHILQVTAIDKRVKAIISQAPMVSGWETLLRLIRPDLVPGINALFAGDRLVRAAGQAAATIPVSDTNTLAPRRYQVPKLLRSTLGGGQSLRGSGRMSTCTIALAREDVTTSVDISLAAYQKAREPKQLCVTSGWAL